MVIMFLGQWIMYKIGDTRLWEYHGLQVIAGIALPLGIYRVAMRYQVFRAVLLGNYNDFSTIFKPWLRKSGID